MQKRMMQGTSAVRCRLGMPNRSVHSIQHMRDRSLLIWWWYWDDDSSDIALVHSWIVGAALPGHKLPGHLLSEGKVSEKLS
jgi:hypothetical protein